MKRKDFLKRSFLLSAGAFVLSPFLRKNETAAQERISTESKPIPSSWKPEEINIAWIGHSTVLINFYGTVILTDPVLFNSIGLYFWGVTFGPYRYAYPALEIDEIPKPDLVLLSHAHMDHMDYKTLNKLSSRYPGQIDCVTAFNTKDVIEDLPWKSLSEIDWYHESRIGNVSIKAFEPRHFGWRFPWEKDRSRGFTAEGRSYNSYVIEKNGKKIFFGGDTAFTDNFRKANSENVDIAIMPIGAYNPWRRAHCNPEEALIMAAEHLNAKYFIPIHCRTFKIGEEPIDEPLKWMVESGRRYNISIGIKNLGETFTL